MKNLQYINIFTFVHFILWVMIGILYPNRYGIAVTLSFLWEIIEGYMVTHSTMYPLLQQYWIIPEKYWNEGIGNKLTDIIANLCGYSLASSVVVLSKYKEQVFCIAFILWVVAIIYAKHNAV